MESTSQVLQNRPITTVPFDQTPINPWTDSGDKNAEGSHDSTPLRTPDPALLDQTVIAGLEAEESPVDTKPPKVPNDVLSQFDPLANLEEEAAREAWKASESHPPPPRSPSPPPPPPLKDAADPHPTESSPSQPSGSFPSLAALARSFAIPALSRSRPASFDAAKAVTSTTLYSFTGQPDALRDDGTIPNGSPSRTTTQSRSRTPSPARERQEVPFDFQKFLDQMKSRGAEPVSKYLRSCVILAMLPS